MAFKCTVCEKYLTANCKQLLLSHGIPNLPVGKLGMDFCTYGNKDYLIACYLSKWLDIIELINKTATEIIDKLEVLFNTHGIPKKSSQTTCYWVF